MNEFIKDALVLIVSSKPSHRSGVRKILIDLGVSNNHIEAAPDYLLAKERIIEGPVNILIMDDDIGSQGNPIDLTKLYITHNSRAHSRLSILMPGSDTDELKMKFTEIGGDLIIEKPYTSATFLNPFKKIIEQKYAFTFEEKMAMEVEEALNKNNRDMAVQYFNSIKNASSPSASYSIGMISMFDKDYIKAYDHFLQSIQIKLDPRVLVHLLASGIKTQKYQELDSYVEQWIENFPLNSKSAPDVTRVVVYNKKFPLLTKMTVTEASANIPLAAGLVVASSFYLAKGDVEKAIDYSIKSLRCFENKPKIMLRAFEILIEAKANDDALKIFEELKESPHFADPELVSNIQKILTQKPNS